MNLYSSKEPQSKKALERNSGRSGRVDHENEQVVAAKFVDGTGSAVEQQRNVNGAHKTEVEISRSSVVGGTIAGGSRSGKQMNLVIQNGVAVVFDDVGVSKEAGSSEQAPCVFRRINERSSTVALVVNNEHETARLVGNESSSSRSDEVQARAPVDLGDDSKATNALIFLGALSDEVDRRVVQNDTRRKVSNGLVDSDVVELELGHAC